MVARLLAHYADALDRGDFDLLARTVSARVVRRGSDGVQGDCVTDRGSPAALSRWQSQLDEIDRYELSDERLKLDGERAQVAARYAINGLKPAPISFEARLDDGVWRLTRVVTASC